MAKSDSPVVVGGVGFLPLLALLFIGLKLGGIISWPWLWVLSPLWGPAVLAFGFLGLVAAVFGFAFIVAVCVRK